MILSDRLSAAASMITPGNRLADIGTDHGFVPIDLVRRRIIPSAIAMDVHRGPLERAREQIEEKTGKKIVTSKNNKNLKQLN